MLKVLLAGIGAVVVVGCSSDARIYPLSIVGQNVTGNETFVTVTNVWNEADALPLAEEHCAQYDKLAKFDQMNGHRAAFECVER